MIILRNKTPRKKNNELFFISTFSDLDGEFVKPVVPNTFLRREKIGDYKTPRVCFYTSIDEALTAMDQNLVGKELYVYHPRNITQNYLYKPTISEVPYTILLDEYWYLDRVELKYIAKIKIIKQGKELTYHYGPRSTKRSLYKWSWEEVLKPWEKKGKLFSDDTVTLYHVTKKENVPSILREGLKGSKATEHANTASMKTGLPVDVLKNKVYLSRSLDNLSAMEVNDKRVILKIEVPVSVFNTWKDLHDPIRNSFKNKEDWANYYIDYCKKNKPEFITKIGGISNLRKLCYQVWKNVSPENTMVIDKDIPAKYIKVMLP